MPLSKLAQSLPAPARRVVRAVFRSLRPRAIPRTVPITFPPDVTDAGTLRRTLRETDVFGEAEHEADGYLHSALERFRITMALVPELPAGTRLLELGANPYFITRLLLERGIDVTCANWFGETSGFSERATQTVTESGVPRRYEFDHFNIEVDPFPYESDSFDVVLFCEILEHLPFDPIHPLAEIHRVLKPGGMLILTTPNAVRLDNLVRMIHGQNVYETLSGYGTYGRHNREYTVDELRALLNDCGYEVTELFAMDIGNPQPDLPMCADVNPAHRGENLFAVARPHGEPRWRYPDWLYSSQHVLTRIVRPDLLMGHNDDLQARGFHHLEEIGGRFARWSGASPEARVRLVAPGGRATLKIEGLAPPPPAGDSLELRAEVDGTKLSWPLKCDGEPFSVDAPSPPVEGEQEVVLSTDRTWRPSEVGMGTDPRSLGVAVSRVALEGREG